MSAAANADRDDGWEGAMHAATAAGILDAGSHQPFSIPDNDLPTAVPKSSKQQKQGKGKGKKAKGSLMDLAFNGSLK